MHTTSALRLAKLRAAILDNPNRFDLEAESADAEYFTLASLLVGPQPTWYQQFLAVRELTGLEQEQACRLLLLPNHFSPIPNHSDDREWVWPEPFGRDYLQVRWGHYKKGNRDPEAVRMSRKKLTPQAQVDLAHITASRLNYFLLFNM